MTTDSNGKKNMVKYSIRDSQDSFIVFKESVEAQQHHLEQLRNRGIPIQPFILIVGTINVQKEILVYFDSAMYKVHSVLRSIEVCFKIFYLFNLEYPSGADWAAGNSGVFPVGRFYKMSKYNNI